MVDFTPHKLLKLATDKIQVLRHASQWKTCQEQSVMALKLELQQQKQESNKIIQRLVAHNGKITNCEDIHRVNLPLHAVELRQLPPYQLLEYLEKIWRVPS